jgi:DNA repair exonuclease SbcCD ATPase subunit
MADLLKTPKEELKKSDFNKEKKKFWQQDTFFSHLILPSIVSFVLIILALTFLIFSLPLWENALFPGIQKIDPLQRDLTILQAKVEQLTHSIQNIQDKGLEIEALKGQLSALQQTVTVLEKNTPTPASSAIQPANESSSPQNFADFKPLWEKLQKSLQLGEACVEELNQLKSKIPSSLENTLQPLVTFTESPAKPLSVLQTELEKIYQELKSSPNAEELVVVSQPNSWWHTIWDYLSKWIHIRTLNKKTAQVSLLTAVEKALESLRKNQLASAIDYLQSIHSVEGIRAWLEDATRRQQCDQVIADFDKRLDGIKQGGNG